MTARSSRTQRSVSSRVYRAYTLSLKSDTSTSGSAND